MSRVFTYTDIRALLTADQLAQIKEDFRRYKETGDLPDTFGRDVPYDSDVTLDSVRSEEIWHLHLSGEDTSWSINLVQFSRTSDTHLVYCEHALYPGIYLLITLLSPDAHSQARNNNVMTHIAEVAKRFRSKMDL